MSNSTGSIPTTIGELTPLLEMEMFVNTGDNQFRVGEDKILTLLESSSYLASYIAEWLVNNHGLIDPTFLQRAITVLQKTDRAEDPDVRTKKQSTLFQLMQFKANDQLMLGCVDISS